MLTLRICITTALVLLGLIPQPLFAQSSYEQELKQLTEDRDRALASAAEPINRRYKASLEQLLRKATQNGDLQTALKIDEALRNLGRTLPVGSIADPSGKWKWTSGRIVTIQSDGKFTVDKGGGGTWRWKNPKKGEFTLTWDKGDYVDTLVISADGAGISGSNNKGDRVNVSRLK